MKKKTSIVFTGDIGFDKYMAGKWQDKRLLSQDVCRFLRSADHLAVNVEGPLSNGEKVSLSNGMTALQHSMDPAVGGFLKKLGADIWSLDNNHIMDAGPQGLSDTLALAAACGAKAIGVGMNLSEAAKPLILPEAGGIGILAVGYDRACRKATVDTPGCLNWSDMDVVLDAIQSVKKTCRWCVVVAHDGEEFTALPSPYTRNRFLRYLETGADIVIAHHPHVPMNYETVGSKAIFYSLGNFIFDTDYQRSQANTEFGVLLKLQFTEDAFSFEPFGLKLLREEGRLVKASLPDIFEDVQPAEYELLAPLAAMMFIENVKRQQRFLYPDKYQNATDADWHENFYEPLRSGRVPGEMLDMPIILELAEKEAEGAWKKSSLEKVKDFITEQL